MARNDGFPGTVEELRTKVDKIDLDAVNGLIGAWTEISTRNSTSLDDFRKQIARGMSPDVWAGSAANAAAQTVAAYDTTGKKVTTAAALTSTKLDELRTGLEPTKRLVPHAPEHRSGLDNVGALLTGRGWRNDDVANENARVEAVRILQTVYAPVIYESDNKVPVIPIPKTIENGGEPETKPTTTQPTTQGSTTQPATQPTTTPTTPASTTPTTDPDDTDDSTDDSTTPESTTPQSTEPGSTTPASTTPSSTIPGSPSGSPSGAGSPGGGSPGAGTPGAGTPGGAVAGSPTAAGSAAGRGTGTGSGTAGRSGMPGMMSPGAGKGGGKDDESTKGIPDYLITQEHGDELTGLDTLPKMVPPVIGAD
ncbi:hypothetical protein [Nocardia sp. NPDC058480]|uniref:hypothetical protein n=1 Tax=Nocardia sp. NPDC058480 TaxID=3346522 RepID=UPI0036546115